MAAIYNRYKVYAVKLKIYMVNNSATIPCDVFGCPDNDTVWNPTTNSDRMNHKFAKW